MSSATLQRPAPPRTGDVGPVRTVLLGLAAGASAALAGVLVTVGLSLVVWAITPSASDPLALMRAGVTAFAAGNGADVLIGSSTLTLSPLLLGVFGWALLWQAVVRTPRPPTARPLQALLGVAAGAAYGAVVLLTGAVAGTPGSMVTGSLWVPVAVAVLIALLAAIRLGAARRAAEPQTPWSVGLRLARIGAVAVVGLGALTLAVGLILSFGQAVTLAGASVGAGFGDGLGLLLLGLAFLPNVIVGALGYATGVGVQVGDATFGPLASSVGDLPALPLLAALPDSAGGALGLAALALPILLGGLLGWSASARLGDLRSRCIAVGTAAALIGLGTAVVALLAAGGVSGGRWADTGVSAWLVGLLLAAELAVTGALVAVLVPRSADGEQPPSRRQRRATERLRTVADTTDQVDDADPEDNTEEKAPGDDAGDDDAGDDDASHDAAGDDEESGEATGGDDAGDREAGEDARAEATVADEPEADDVSKDRAGAPGVDPAPERSAIDPAATESSAEEAATDDAATAEAAIDDEGGRDRTVARASAEGSADDAEIRVEGNAAEAPPTSGRDQH